MRIVTIGSKRFYCPTILFNCLKSNQTEIERLYLLFPRFTFIELLEPNLYDEVEYNNKKWSKDEVDSIKPLIHGPENPKILLISQAPSLQAWLNGKTSNSPDGGLVTIENNFLIDSLLPAFGLSAKDLDTFKEHVFWIHACNCYPWYRISQSKKTGIFTRQDRLPSNKQSEKCLGQWLDRLLKIDSINAIILMGGAATSLFPQLYEKSENFTDLVREVKIRSDIIDGIDILPIYHQSRKNRVFNDPIDNSKNEKIKSVLKDNFIKWIQ
ncbi:hypothetical protein Mpsy_0191 [Methanolobus psychrophilus R15]|nr:hypothetical protein Mpsy_0191 [Methanolobus psychrophilus R15]